MVVPVSAQISKLRPCPPYRVAATPTHLHHVASISLPFSAASAYFPSPRRCYPSLIPSGRLSNAPSASRDFPPCQPSCLHRLAASCPLFALFSALVPFVFNRLQPLFAKHPEWGCVPIRSLGTRRVDDEDCPVPEILVSDTRPRRICAAVFLGPLLYWGAFETEN
jgi:hypothetical protein